MIPNLVRGQVYRLLLLHVAGSTSILSCQLLYHQFIHLLSTIEFRY